MSSKRQGTDDADAAAQGLMVGTEETRQLVSFAVGEQTYCVDIFAVREIRMWTGATPLPNSPDYICGVINLRGTIATVVDLRRRFGLPDTEAGTARVVVIVAIDSTQVGLLVDSVADIVTVRTKDISDIPKRNEMQNPLFEGLVAGREGLTALISLQEILSPRSATFQSSETHASAAA